MHNILVIDGNHMLHRAYHRFKRMTSRSGESTSCIYGFPSMLSSMVRRFKPDQLIIIFDGGRSQYRLDILPEYKKREPRLDFDVEDFVKQKSEVMKYCQLLGATVVYERNSEGDDWVYPIYRVFKKSMITLVSGDKDFNQLIAKRFHIWNPNHEILYTLKNFKNRQGFFPHQTSDYLSLLGDKSDNIEGYRGVGEKTAKTFLEEHASIKEFLDSDKEFKRIDKIKLAEIYRINRKLINLKYYYRKNQRGVKLPILNKKAKFQLDKVIEFNNKYDMASFNKSEFLELFQ